MRATFPQYCLWSVGLFAASTVLGQPQSPTPAPRDITKSDSSKTQPRMSSELAASLTAGIKYDVPGAEKKKPDPDEEAAAAEADKPRNGIVRLPKYVIEGDRPPVFTERELNTPKGLADIAVKRYLSSVHQNLNRFHLPGWLGGVSNEELAMQMYREDERLQNMKQMEDTSYILRKAGDNKAADEMKEQSRDMYMRRSEFVDPPRSDGR